MLTWNTVLFPLCWHQHKHKNRNRTQWKKFALLSNAIACHVHASTPDASRVCSWHVVLYFSQRMRPLNCMYVTAFCKKRWIVRQKRFSHGMSNGVDIKRARMAFYIQSHPAVCHYKYCSGFYHPQSFAPQKMCDLWPLWVTSTLNMLFVKTARAELERESNFRL